MAKKAEVELARIITRGSVAKTAIVCATIVSGLLIVCITAYKMTAKPPWLVVVLSVVTALAGPSCGLGIVIWLRKRYISKHHRDRVVLEKQIDPSRRSSNP